MLDNAPVPSPIIPGPILDRFTSLTVELSEAEENPKYSPDGSLKLVEFHIPVALFAPTEIWPIEFMPPAVVKL